MTIKPEDSIGRKRLMALGDYVEQQAALSSEWARYFDMTYWFSDVKDVVARLDLRPGDEVPVNGSCGTTACLLGHAVNVPMLRDAGLSSVLDNIHYEAVFAVNGVATGADEVSRMLFGIDHRRFRQIFTESGFDLGEDETDAAAECQFETFSDVTPSAAVENLRHIVREIDADEGWQF